MKKKGQKDNAAKQEAKARKKEEKIRKKAEKNEQKSKKKKEKEAAKAQKQKAKAAAKAKKQDAKKAKAAAKKNKQQSGAEQSGEGKKRLNKKLLIPLLVLLLAGTAAAANFVLGGKALPAAEVYAIAEESTRPLDDFLAEESKLVKIRQAKLEDAEEEAEAAEEVEDAEDEAAKPVPIDTVLTYEYKDVTADALDEYVAVLLAEEQGFRMVDDEYNAMKGVPGFHEMTDEEIEAFAAAELQDLEPPELGPLLNDEGEEIERKMSEGSQLFARAAAAEGRVFQVRITWTAKGKCSVEVSCPKGAFPVTEEKEEYMNQSSAMDFVSRMSPADLGLPGESMDEYHTYSQGSNVMVEGEMYRKFTVYTINEKTNTNDFVGVFLISGNGRSIYRQDGITGELSPVK